jgi:hypothetical protein
MRNQNETRHARDAAGLDKASLLGGLDGQVIIPNHATVQAGNRGRPQHRVHGFNPALCKISDEALRATELKEWGSIARACDRHLADLTKYHSPSCSGSRQALRQIISAKGGKP